MTSQEFGELIRIQREKKGLTLEELAARFKLSLSTLRSIEDGSLQNLPHVVYARGFVRSYAQAVGVDAGDLAAGMEALFPQSLFDDVPTPPTPVNAKAARSGKSFADKLMAMLIVLVVIGVPLGVGWFVYANYGERIAEMVKKPFSATASSQQAPEGSAPLAAPNAVEPRTPPAPDPAPVPQASAAQPVQEPAARISAAEAAVPVPQTATPQAANGPAAPSPVEGAHVSLQAKEECWVEVVVDGGGKRTFIIYPGEISVLPYKKKITLVLGNAGGVTVTHNNQQYPLAGKRNEKRTLTFP